MKTNSPFSSNKDDTGNGKFSLESFDFQQNNRRLCCIFLDRFLAENVVLPPTRASTCDAKVRFGAALGGLRKLCGGATFCACAKLVAGAACCRRQNATVAAGATFPSPPGFCWLAPAQLQCRSPDCLSCVFHQIAGSYFK